MRQAQNLMATLVLATGLPMITAGDELGRTQHGNNNAYCQDSPISWVHWDTARRLVRADRADPEAARAARRASGVPAQAFRHGEQIPDCREADRTEESGLVRRPRGR